MYVIQNIDESHRRDIRQGRREDVSAIYCTFIQNVWKHRDARHIEETGRGRDTSSCGPYCKTYTLLCMLWRYDGAGAAGRGVLSQAFPYYRSNYCNRNVSSVWYKK